MASFTSTGTCEWTVPAGVTQVDYLVVGGGGGGGSWVGGGGGGGGVVEGTSAVTPGDSLSIVVGAGGAGTSSTEGTLQSAGTNGADSVFLTMRALGGGRGSSYEISAAAPTSGSSGGGGSSGPSESPTWQRGQVGVPGQGFSGGDGRWGNNFSGGGGGGAGGAGTTSSQSSSVAGNGGAGKSSSITGTATFYGGGGGGGVYSSLGTAGTASGGGGAGGRDGNGSNGTAGRGGGGGGGAGGGGKTTTGGSGGSGIVIVRYLTTTTTCSSSTTTSGVYTIVQFTGTGGCTSSWTVPAGVTLAESLVQAGGGGGGAVYNASGGGGGAGGLVSTEGRPVAVTPGASLSVLVGAGGAGGVSGTGVVTAFTGGSGGDSALGTAVAEGGGGGAGGIGDVPGFAIAMSTAGSGGSGGGGVTYNTTMGAAGTGIFGQGHAGGSFAGTAGRTYGSGGGGAGGPGVPSYFESGAQWIGAGGPARFSSFTGTLTAYGAGGAGRSRGIDDGSGTNATNSTGAGGGGAAGSSTANGGTGGSGIVLVRYRTPPTAACPAPTKVGSVWRMTATSDCLWTVPARLTSVDAVVVGGGGGGGGTGSVGGSGGGGGAGGVVTLTGATVTPAAVMSIFVGSGGAGGTSTTLAGGQGLYSAFGATVANGGGGGGGGNGDRVAAGMSGGSGGGSTAFNEFTGVAGAGTAGQGNAGGNATGVRSYTYASGGGGAGGAGAAATSFTAGATWAGGPGVASTISGTTVGAGGAGLNRVASGSTNGSNGTASTGNGGSAGSSNAGSTSTGGAGGSGVVAITYTRACAPTASLVGAYTLLTIDDPGGCDWTPPAGLPSVEHFLVGGGGGAGSGGSAQGGGGGGGGVVASGTTSLTGAAVAVRTGTGGATEVAGSASLFGSATAAGGGAGTAGAAVAGGAGGGGSSGSFTGGAGIGSAGGQGASSSSNGSAAQNQVRAGTTDSITGSSVSYGDGGGAGWYNAHGGRGSGPGAGGGGLSAQAAGNAPLPSGLDGTVILKYQTVRTLAVTTAPTAAGSGGLLSTQPVVALRDVADATVTTDSFTTVTVTANPGARVVGTTTVTASNGVATFTDLRVFSTVGTPVTLTFTTNSPEPRTTTASVTTQQVACPTSARSFSGGRTIWAITTLGECTWTAPSTLITPVSYLAVGGGGGGALGGQSSDGRGGGGGGGGEVILGSTTIAAGAATAVTVGAGGPAGAAGESSAFNSVTAGGGGGGTAGGLQSAPATSGGVGGSSGSRVGGSGSGSAGGQGASSSSNGAANSKDVIAGTSNSITGSSVRYGDGGGGGWGAGSGAGLRGSGPGAGGGGGEANTALTSTAAGLAGTVVFRHQTVQSLAFVTSPVGGVVGGSLGTQPVLELLDGNGTRVTSDSSTTVTVTVSSGPLTGTTTVTASSGVITFTDLAMGTATGSYTLTFTTAGLPDTQVSTTSSVTRDHSVASQLVFTTQPSTSTVAGVAFAAQPVVQIQDPYGNLVTTGADATRSVTLTPSSGSLVGTASVSASGGVATFTGLSMTTEGTGRTIQASATLTGGAATATSTSFAITPAAASAAQSSLSASTSSMVVGTSTVTLTVQAKDASGNNLTIGGATVVVSRASGTGSVGSVTDNGDGTYSATVTAPAGAGSGVFVATLGGSAVEGGSGSQTQVTVTYTAGTASKYLVTVSTASPTVGGAVTVTAQLADANNNPVSLANQVVTWSASASATGQSLSAATTNTDANGVATVTLTASSVPGTARTVTATTGSVTGTSPTITTQAGAASKYLVTVSTASPTVAGAVTVTAQLADANNNPVSLANQVVTWTKNTAGGTLTVSSTTNASGEATATFTTETVSGISTTVTATTGSISGTSPTVTTQPGSPTQLVVVTPPVAGDSGAPLTTQPVVQFRDQYGNRTTSTDSVTASVSAASGSASLGGTVVLNAVNGEATFTNLTLAGLVGTNLTFSFSGGGFNASAAPIQVAGPGPAAQLQVATAPSATSASGAVLATQPVIRVTDAQGNVRTSDSSTVITASVTNGSVSGGTTATAFAGIATFVGLSVSGVSGQSVTVTFAATGLTPITVSVSMTSGAPHGMSIVQAPTPAALGQPMSPAPTVQLVDSGGNAVSAAGVQVSAALVSGSAILTGATATTDSTGLATFTGLTVTGDAGPTYAMQFSAPGLVAATASAVSISPQSQTITFDQADVAFGSPVVQLAGSATSGLPVTYALNGSLTTNSACTVSSSGAVTVLAVGTCGITASQAGNASWSTAASVDDTFLVTGTAPSPPSILSVSASAGAVTVAFAPPTSDGGVPLDPSAPYIVTAVGGGSSFTRTCTSSPCTLAGLPDNVVYTVTLQATNASGTSVASPASATVTPSPAVLAVTALSAIPGNGSLDLAWTPSANVDDTAFASYKLYITPQGTFGSPAATLTSRTDASYLFTGLSNGTTYSVQVVTELKNGTIGTASVQEFAAITPDPPASPTVAPLSPTSAEFSWSIPASNGGAPLDPTSPYVVTITSSTPGAASPLACGTITNRGCTVTGMTPGATYSFAVQASNRRGLGPAATQTYSVPSNVATLTSTVATGTNGPVTLTPTSANAYTAQVTAADDTLVLTPSASAGSTITINGVAVPSGSPSPPISLAAGQTSAISIVVTAPDGVTTQTTTISVSRPGTASQLLITTAPAAGVSGSALTTQPVIRIADATSTTVATATNAVTVTSSGGTLGCTGGGTTCLTQSAVSGVATFAGVTFTGTAGVTYTLSFNSPGLTAATATITPAAPSNIATLSGLTVLVGGSPVALTPSFSSGVTSYSASVSSSVTSVTVSATSTAAGAQVSVNGSTGTGSASATVSLSVGANAVTIVSTAVDGVTTRTTTLTVTRSTPGPGPGPGPSPSPTSSPSPSPSPTPSPSPSPSPTSSPSPSPSPSPTPSPTPTPSPMPIVVPTPSPAEPITGGAAVGGVEVPVVLRPVDPPAVPGAVPNGAQIVVPLPPSPSDPDAGSVISTITGPVMVDPTGAPPGVQLIPGTPVAITVGGIEPGTLVAIYAMPSETLLGTYPVGENGRVVANPTIPPGTEDVSSLQIAADVPGGVPINLAVSVTVLPPAEPVTRPNGSLPAPVAGSTYVTVNGVPTPTEPTRTPVQLSVREEGAVVAVATRAQDRNQIPVDPQGVLRVVSTGTVEVTGSGMTGWVDVFAFSTASYLGRIMVAADGTFRGLLPVPSRLPDGRHTLQVVGAAATGREVSVALPMVKSSPVPASRLKARVLFAPGSLKLTRADVKKLRALTDAAIASSATAIISRYNSTGSKAQVKVSKERATVVARHIRKMRPGIPVRVSPRQATVKAWPSRSIRVITTVPSTRSVLPPWEF